MFEFEGSKEGLPPRRGDPITDGATIIPGLMAQLQNDDYDFDKMAQDADEARENIKGTASISKKRKKPTRKSTRQKTRVEEEPAEDSLEQDEESAEEVEPAKNPKKAATAIVEKSSAEDVKPAKKTKKVFKEKLQVGCTTAANLERFEDICTFPKSAAYFWIHLISIDKYFDKFLKAIQAVQGN